MQQRNVPFVLVLGVFCFQSLLCLADDVAQTYKIFGLVEPKTFTVDVHTIRNTCYEGFGLDTCVDDTSAGGWKANETVQLSKLTGDKKYCLDCCSSSRLALEVDETWHLKCKLQSKLINAVNAFNYEFRFARFNTLDDTTIVTCALPRNKKDSFLQGYTLDLTVIEMYNDGVYWRSVQNCSATPMEINSKPEYFYETLHKIAFLRQSEAPRANLGVTIVASIVGAIVGIALVPIIRGKILGKFCSHCSSWVTFGLCSTRCASCIVLSALAGRPRVAGKGGKSKERKPVKTLKVGSDDAMQDKPRETQQAAAAAEGGITEPASSLPVLPPSPQKSSAGSPKKRVAPQ